MDLSALFPAFFQALEPGMLGMVLLGTILGIVVGSLPGLTSTMGVALLVPFTFSMSPAMGLALLGAIYASSSYAGSISAILLNIPGTPSNCCTLLDGYPMTQKGQASRRLSVIYDRFGSRRNSLCLCPFISCSSFSAFGFGIRLSGIFHHGAFRSRHHRCAFRKEYC